MVIDATGIGTPDPIVTVPVGVATEPIARANESLTTEGWMLSMSLLSTRYSRYTYPVPLIVALTAPFVSRRSSEKKVACFDEAILARPGVFTSMCFCIEIIPSVG